MAFPLLRVVVASACLFIGGTTLATMGRNVATEDVQPRSPWIETRAPGVFDPNMPALAASRATYRVDAQLLVPLGFTSIPLLWRSDVGVAVASYRDCRTEGDDIVRAFEFFSASRPERARGVDRRGFFREAVHLTSAGAAWTAYFGAMTTWPEKSFAEARRSADLPPSHVYEAIDGMSSNLSAASTVFHLSTDGPLTRPNELWEAMRRQMETARPRYSNAETASPSKPLPSLAFLGAVETSLRLAAIHRDNPLPQGRTRLAFSYNGEVRYLELASCTRQPDAARQHPGFVRKAADIFKLRFVIVNPKSGNSPFVMWAELPAGLRDDGRTPPIVPLGWEMELRSYLKLAFTRTN